MKLELNKGEVTTVVNMRAWAKAFGKMQVYTFLVFLGPAVAVVAFVVLLLGYNNLVTAVFLVIGILVAAFIPNVIKKFKTAKKEILNNVVTEEHNSKV